MKEDRLDLLVIIKFCAEEVTRQGDAPVAVYWMVNAWLRAIDEFSSHRYPSFEIIETLGSLVQPSKNPHGYRRHGVFVGDRVCPDWHEVPRLMKQLVYHFPDIEPWEAYKEFEEIHPFADGNGRVGKIIFNWLSGTLKDPIFPPDLFNCANP